ncbi:cytochrome ubiquinol oxidase subunit I [Corallococcus sicarius]|uniref:Cytochrome ubiquinol oxidase subunit I n=2 Tax=Corallococcus sicarius TaxID=2316726 RepID=A0A3A8NYG9_9BACT|nr:cytochrome ubiquinol oxidase subunit I [Corallococcus sicarius]
MDALFLHRLQFASTTLYHFLFVPLTLGLSLLVAVMQTLWFRTGDDTYRQMVKFWGKLFLLNFAMGVVTGIVQEFQFGMNWSEYSRFVGDIFGGPLAIEALMAFFVESTFIGLWIFGWERLSRRVHLACIWMVAIASNISAFWILTANSFMQEPTGYVLRNGRAEMVDFFALVTNPHLWVQVPHVFFSGLCTGAFVVMGVSAFHLARRTERHDVFARSLRMGVVAGCVGTVMVMMAGHTQAQHMVKAQPMKMAAAEALWTSEDPASFSLFTVGNEREQRDVFSVRIPSLLSVLAYNRTDGRVEGLHELQAQYVAKYGPGDYVPPVAITYWSFRAMVGGGVAMLALAFLGLFRFYRGRLDEPGRYLRLLPWCIPLPFIANSAGWLMTEVGRQPWIVFGLLRVEQGMSPTVSSGMVLTSLIAFTALYTALLVPFLFLMRKFAFGPAAPAHEPATGPVLAPF